MLSLTEQQQRFVLHFTTTAGAIGNASEAARLAGYSAKTAAEQGHQLLQKPHVRDAVDVALRQQLSGPLATKAIAVLERALDDPDTPTKLKIDAAKAVLDRASFGATRAPDIEALAGRARKRVHEMSVEELGALIEDLQSERLANREVAGRA